MKFLFFFVSAIAMASAGHLVAPVEPIYQGAQHLPVIGANGVPVDTPAVQQATAAHLAHKVEAHARNGDYAVAKHYEYPEHQHHHQDSHYEHQHQHHYDNHYNNQHYDGHYNNQHHDGHFDHHHGHYPAGGHFRFARGVYTPHYNHYGYAHTYHTAAYPHYY